MCVYMCKKHMCKKSRDIYLFKSCISVSSKPFLPNLLTFE